MKDDLTSIATELNVVETEELRKAVATDLTSEELDEEEEEKAIEKNTVRKLGHSEGS